MSLLLTDRQKTDLHNAILEYLTSQGDKFSNTIKAFKEEANPVEIVENSRGLLEKKWTSVIRLQKKIMELESKLESLQKHKAFGPDSSTGTGKMEISPNSKLLPKAPASSCLTGHRGPVTQVCTHPVFSLVASGSEDSTIRLWDHETAQYERTLKGHTGSITGLAFDARGTFLASCSSDMSAKLWDMNTFVCTKTMKGHDHTLSSISFLPSGERLVTCSRDKTVKCWEVSTGYCVNTFSGHLDWVKCLAVSLDGNYIASGSTDQTIIIWAAASGDIVQTLRGHEHVIETVCFGKKPSIDAAAIVASHVKGGDVNSKQEPTKDDGSFYLASGSRDRTIKLWDPLHSICLMTFSSHENWVRSVVFHPFGKHLISCGDDKSIRVFDIKEGRCIRTIPDAHTHFVSSICMSSNYPVLVSGSVDKNICIWNCS